MTQSDALTAAVRALCHHSDKSTEIAVRECVAAFLDNVVVSDATVAAVQRAEEWSSFWSPDDAAALIRCALRQLQTDI